MNVLLSGASGFVGSHLADRLKAQGYRVLHLGRRPMDFNWSDESLERGVNQADVVIHLAGENLFGKPWTVDQKHLLRASRTATTRKLASLVAERKPDCFINASAIGYYGPGTTQVFNEDSPHGEGFLANLCNDWELATSAARDAGVRTVIVRIGVVLGLGGGALAKMLPSFRFGLGGPLGNGKQWVSWVHIDDLVALFIYLMERPRAKGVFNGTAPNPVTMKQFARSLGRALHRPAIFPVPAPVLRFALGEVADILLTGQQVEARRTLETGFDFKFEDIDHALVDIVRRKPS